MSVEEFFRTARERESIRLSRETGNPQPWTEDPVFRRWKFCNVFREDDKTTRWFRENVRSQLDPADSLVRATVIFRWFNLIETGEVIKDLLLSRWDSVEAYSRLRGREQIFTGAFIINSAPGEPKLDCILRCIDVFLTKEREIVEAIRGRSLRHAQSVIEKSAPRLGRFMTYEVVTDLSHTSILNPIDLMTWASAGPGCARGLGLVFRNNEAAFNYGSRRDQVEMLELMAELLCRSRDSRLWPWREWTMREVEHWSCEYAKYRAAQAGRKLKRCM